MIDMSARQLQERVRGGEVAETDRTLQAGARGLVRHGVRDDVRGENRIALGRGDGRLDDGGEGVTEQVLSNDDERVRGSERVDLDDRLRSRGARTRNGLNDVRRWIRCERIIENFECPAIIGDVHMHGS